LRSARGGSAQQFVRDQADALFELRAPPLPRFAAEPVERQRLVRRAVAGEDVDILDRDVELVAPGIFQHHAIVLAPADSDRFEPEILPDPVLDMDDEVSGIEG